MLSAPHCIKPKDKLNGEKTMAKGAFSRVRKMKFPAFKKARDLAYAHRIYGVKGKAADGAARIISRALNRLVNIRLFRPGIGKSQKNYGEKNYFTRESIIRERQRMGKK